MTNNESESQELQDGIRFLLVLYEEYKSKCETEEYKDLDRDTIRKMTEMDVWGLASQWGISEDRMLAVVKHLRDNGLVEKPSLRLANLTRRGVEYVERNLLG